MPFSLLTTYGHVGEADPGPEGVREGRSGGGGGFWGAGYNKQGEIPPTPPYLFSGRRDLPHQHGGWWGVPPPRHLRPSGPPYSILETPGNAMPGCCATVPVTQFRSGGWGYLPPARYFSKGWDPPPGRDVVRGTPLSGTLAGLMYWRGFGEDSAAGDAGGGGG